MPRRRSASKKSTGGRRQTRRKTAGRRRSASRRRSFGLRRWLILALVGAALTGVLYTLYLDRLVTLKFEGKRWAIPARVYARPMELYAGAAVTPRQLEFELTQLGYRRTKHPDSPGAYSRYRERFLLRTRPFRFWDGEDPSRYLEVRFEGERVSRVRDAGNARRVPLVRLEAPLVGSIFPAHNEDRVLLKRDDMPDLLEKALLAVEDKGFYRHHGLDPRAVLRAMWANIRAGGVVQGGSTLTQQLVKNFFLTRERSLWRKINEALMAIIVEQRYTKDEILEAYANEIYLGQDGRRAIHGFGLASHFYFNRPLKELELPHIALMVALVRGPSHYEPRRHPERAKERRDLVLQILEQQGVVTAGEASRAKRSDLGVSEKGGTSGSGYYPAFLDLVRRQLHRDYREEDLNSEGLLIHTTLNPWIQREVERAFERRLKTLEKTQHLGSGTLEGAAVVVSAADAEVLAVAGGRQAGYAGFNRALDAVRPIGSLVKPAVYLEALSRPRRYTLQTRIDDAPISLKSPDGMTWTPRNFDRQAHGLTSLSTALARSYNLATVRLGMEVGLDAVTERLGQLGVGREIERYPSLLLGAVSLSPMEVTQIYQVFAAGGFSAPIRAIREVLDAGGQPLNRYPLTVKKVADPGAVYLVNRVLEAVVTQGTGRLLTSWLPESLRVAGKTGTTDDLRDSWFAGFTNDKVTVVWVGRDDNKPAGLTGARGAMRVWSDIIERTGSVPLALSPPDNVQDVWIEPDSGLLADDSCTGAVQVPFIRGSAPTEESPCVTGGTDFFKRLFE